MAFLDNSGDIILDAVLTDLGRQRMARGDGSFRISKFALSDDEINYGLWNKGDDIPDADIANSPILEALTNNSSTLKSFLVTYPSDDLVYLPIMKMNTLGVANVIDSSLSNMYHIVVNDETKDSLANNMNTQGYIDASPTSTAPHTKFIRVDQGIDNISHTPSITLPSSLTETSYEIALDSRLLSLHTKGRTAASVNYTDDDAFDYYYVNLNSGSFVTNNANTTAESFQTIIGSRGTVLEFALGSSLDVSDSDYLFTLLGGGTTVLPPSTGFTYKYIDTNVRIKGMTTGYTINIPVRVIRK